MRRERVGIKDVAAAAGVSVTTVSHAMSGKGRLPASTRHRVQRVARELAYRPSSTARNLLRGRTGLLGLAVAQDAEAPFGLVDVAYFLEIMAGATEAALARGHALVLVPGHVDEEGLWGGLEVDGGIVVDPLLADPLVRALGEAGAPVVTTGRVPGGPAGPSVDNDHVLGTREVLDHLAERGARRIALVVSPPRASYAIDCARAYEAWCAERGAEPLVAVSRSDVSESAGLLAALELLGRPDPPDAIYAAPERLGLGALLAAETRGVRVPDELLVAGCGDSEAARLARPPLTVLALDPGEIGRRAVEVLVDLVEGREPAEPAVVVPSRVVTRTSTARGRR